MSYGGWPPADNSAEGELDFRISGFNIVCISSPKATNSLVCIIGKVRIKYYHILPHNHCTLSLRNAGTTKTKEREKEKELPLPSGLTIFLGAGVVSSIT